MGELAQVQIGVCLESKDSVCEAIALGVPCDASDNEKDSKMSHVELCTKHRIDRILPEDCPHIGV